MISIIVVTKREELYSQKVMDCLASIDAACEVCEEPTEVLITALPGRAAAINTAALHLTGNILVIVDSDCTVSKDFLSEVSEKGRNPYFIGGGVKWVRLSRYSVGILLWLLPIATRLLWKQITVGAFWVRKEVFLNLGGFQSIDGDDIDFALRLKKYAKQTHTKFESIKKAYITWSTRKFDIEGDWMWLHGGKIHS